MSDKQQSWPDSSNLAYVEALYERYCSDPQSVDREWRRQFEQWAMGGMGHVSEEVGGKMESAGSRGNGETPPRLGPTFRPRSIFNPVGTSRHFISAEPAKQNGHLNGHGKTGNGQAVPVEAPGPGTLLRQGSAEQAARLAGIADAQVAAADAGSLQHRVDQLIRNYRVRGHIVANLDPLSEPNEHPEELDPSYYGLTDADMDRPFYTSSVPGDNTRTLREIIEQMRETYTRSIGAQFMHIDNLEVREWLQRRMEASRNRTDLSRKEQIRILTRLTDAVIFEEFIQKKFIGAKSFSLEGAESLIPLMDLAFEKAGEQGVHEIVIGMAHRGRLNVLANILGKSPQKIFREFEDIDPKLYLGGGDVKYHLGYSGDWRTRGGQNIHLSLCFNPSHLEYVNPVALGRMRAKQDRTERESRGELGVTMLIHGDAAFAGEGIVQETLNMSNLDGYTTGGTLHIVVNNQIGFTTMPKEGRSSRYATDVARMLQIPIFHVNGESPEAVTQVVRLAMDFRAQFKRDVVIDMYCYRRRGHNEGDEPSYTQPRTYEAIRQRESIRDSYLGHLLELGGVTKEDADRIAERRTEILEKELSAARSENFVDAEEQSKFAGVWANYRGGLENEADDLDTGVDKQTLSRLMEMQTRLPDNFHIHPKLKRLMKLKQEMAQGERPLDWSAAESLALASLAAEGHRIRMAGQDTQRGTFSQRHAMLHDVNDGHAYCPLQHVAEKQAQVEIYNSPLCEAGVLGFEYGYSLDFPCGLVVWEAQFGDFVNAAQVIIDQFIASAEDKWRRLSGLVLLLPHGFEGQGPEHSSARLERFLELAAEDNMQVVNPTTPAQYFHVLRRQVVRPWRKPLIVMTPKSLLRHPRAVSPLEDLAAGRFQRVIPDEQNAGNDGVEKVPAGRKTKKANPISRVLLCSGKIYYDLVAEREKLDRRDVAIVRLEQYYPFPRMLLEQTLARYSDKTPVFWVQEEPRNMGAWPFLKGMFCHRLLDRLDFDAVTRAPSSSPATGSRAAHQMEQARIMAAAFGEG